MSLSTQYLRQYAFRPWPRIFALLERMQLLRRFTGAQFDRLRAAFLECLAAPAHRSTASVRCCLATL